MTPISLTAYIAIQNKESINIDLSVDGHLHWFHSLANVNSAVTNINMQMSL